jgi:hypothetical protein
VAQGSFLSRSGFILKNCGNIRGRKREISSAAAAASVVVIVRVISDEESPKCHTPLPRLSIISLSVIRDTILECKTQETDTAKSPSLHSFAVYAKDDDHLYIAQRRANFGLVHSLSHTRSFVLSIIYILILSTLS